MGTYYSRESNECWQPREYKEDSEIPFAPDGNAPLIGMANYVEKVKGMSDQFKGIKTREYCAPEVDNGSTRGRSADIFSLGAVFLEMIITYTYPDGFKELKDVLESPSQQGSSYAKHIDEVHKWTNEKLHPVGWQDDVLSACQKMLHPDRSKRPSARELDGIWSSLSASDESLACKCAGDVVMTDSNKLVEACKGGSEDEVKRLLNDGTNPGTMGAIHFAAERGSKAIVEALLDHGAGVDILNPISQTALHCAARSGSENVVRLLLEHGADVNAKDENGQTALQGAAGQGYESIVRMLLDSRADVGAEDIDGDTAFHFAHRRHHNGEMSRHFKSQMPQVDV
ncbi:hypothetical protein G7Z17_g4173 [Cylindrodendrum hubeiense]|uniref:Protein kinase domain-containing protein n=1 Tax=Cylindrodendrum hubeiense TaxID=595255 RepID=A0A9P5LJ65_9HYPO|nr:hypothetical protein G7Z17_g4173 [Cylindrodendrum hubeiense]